MLTKCSTSKNKLPCQLGRGGFGIVYLNKDAEKKLIATKLLKNNQYAKAFKEQYENLLQLKKKGICNKFICVIPDNIREDQQRVKINMEYLKNYIELFDYVIDETIPKTYTDRSLICERLIQSMNLLHKNGMVHCDLKLENIMILREDGEIKDVRIIDFGGIIMEDSKRKQYKLKAYTYILKNTKKTYTFEELKIHDRFSMGICIGLLIGYKNENFSKFFDTLYNFGAFKKNIATLKSKNTGSVRLTNTIPFRDLNILQQLNIIYSSYIEMQENLFQNDDIKEIYNTKLDPKITNKEYSNFLYMKQKFLNLILPQIDYSLNKNSESINSNDGLVIIQNKLERSTGSQYASL